jgi:hypothetical protein
VVQKLCVAKNCLPLVYLSQIYGNKNNNNSNEIVKIFFK